MSYGIYRERPRSAVLISVMFEPRAAIEHAQQLERAGYGPLLVADMGEDGPVDAFRYNDPTAPRYIARTGDWDSRSAWQPYPAPGSMILR